MSGSELFPLNYVSLGRGGARPLGEGYRGRGREGIGGYSGAETWFDGSRRRGGRQLRINNCRSVRGARSLAAGRGAIDLAFARRLAGLGSTLLAWQEALGYQELWAKGWTTGGGAPGGLSIQDSGVRIQNEQPRDARVPAPSSRRVLRSVEKMGLKIT